MLLRLTSLHFAARMTRVLQSVLLLALYCSVSGGCLRAITDKPLELPASEAAKDAPAKTPEPVAEVSLADVEATLTTKVTRPDPATKLPTVEVVDGWYRAVGAEDQWTTPPGEFRWRHDGLATLLKSSGSHDAALKAASKSDDQFVRAAGLIGLARLHPNKNAKPLAALARDTNLPLSTRRAAVETLATSSVAETEAQLRALEERFGTNDRGVIAEPLLYAEVLVGLARHVAVDQDPLFTLALTAPDNDVQLAALSLWSARQGLQLPEEAVALTKSTHARIRRAALAALVASEHPSMVEALRDATQDADLQVRVAAIELLGQVKQHEAIILLNAQAQHEQERHREAAAAALVVQQEWSAVERVAQDSSFRVRAALAIALSKAGQRERVPLAQMLLKDSSAMVQAKMCQSLAKWPADVAAPLLFTALESHNMLTRQEAHQSLQTLGVDVAGFNPGAPPPERKAKLAALSQQWHKQHPLAARAAIAQPVSGKLSLDEVAQLLAQYQKPGDRTTQWIARKQLERLGEPILPVLDQLALERGVTIEETTFRDLLAGISPSLQQIELLRAADVAQRRTAARQLVAEARRVPLSRLALERLSNVARAESDSLVWADVLRAAGFTPTFAAHDLALAALAHSEADVRRRACEYLTACGDKRQADALARLIDDRDPLVAKAAVLALGKCGLPEQRAGLHALLTHTDANMQVAAARTLAKWQDERGGAALERMVVSATPATRRLAIAAMAELEDARFVDVLVQALDDEASVQLAALNALPKAAGQDVIQSASPAPISADEKARVWQAWHAERR